jgi:hypothetical protein
LAANQSYSKALAKKQTSALQEEIREFDLWLDVSIRILQNMDFQKVMHTLLGTQEEEPVMMLFVL